MRDFLNAILAFVGAESLTDVEFASIDEDLSYGYNSDTYDALASMLETREAVSTTQDRLSYFFRAKGVEITVNATGTSNIYVGSVLC